MQDRSSRKNTASHLTVDSPSSAGHLTPLPEFTVPPPSLSPAPEGSSTMGRGQSPLDVDPSSLVGLGISSSSGPARRASSTPSSRRTPGATGPSTSGSGKTSPPYAKKKGKDDKPAGKDMRKSCAECRRLKAKCDRVFPCSNCRRRGCALVCPDGDLGCMQGKRLVLASTEQLHERIAKLETALSQAHGKSSSTPHPLLAPEFLDGGFASQPPPAVPTRGATSDSLTQAGDSLEGLALSEELAQGSDVDVVAGAVASGGSLPPDFRPDAASRPAIMSHLRTILNILPSREEARQIADRFFLEAEWYNYILRREEYDGLYEPSVYASTEHNPLSLHKLACVLMVCALQLYLDPMRDLEAVDSKVAVYWDAAQQCFDTRCGWTATIPGVQALALMTAFVNFSSKGGGETGPGALSLYWLRRMTAAAQELQLNTEPHPSVPIGEANFRRRVFWEATALDCVMSPSLGHHTGIPVEQIEVRYPNDVPQWSIMRYEYIRTVSYPAIDLGLRSDSDPPNPHEIRGLEELLAHYTPEAQPAIHCPYLVGEPLPELRRDSIYDVSDIQRTTVSMTLYQSYFCFYRASLRRIIAGPRANPDIELTSWDRHIVMRTFETAQNIFRIARYIHRAMPRIATRHTALWAKIFTATVSIAASAIWCGQHMTPSFVGQVMAELNGVSQLAGEASALSAVSERPQATREVVPVLQSMIVGRFPHVVGGSPTRVSPNIVREDLLFALIGGTVDTVRGMQTAQDWASALSSGSAFDPGALSAPMSWTTAPGMPRRDISPAMLHTPGPEAVADRPSPFPGTASPFAFGGQGYIEGATDVSPHQVSPPHGPSGSNLTPGIMPPQSVFADAAMMPSPPQPTGGMIDPSGQNVSSELWNRLQTMYHPNPWWGVDEDAAGTSAPYTTGSTISTTSAPASLSTSMTMAAMGDSRPPSAPYTAPQRMVSLSPAPPVVPRVINAPGLPPQPLAPQGIQQQELMPPPSVFSTYPESR